MRERLFRLIKIYIGILLFGIAYGIFVYYTNMGIPCVFYHITGLKCPGCGVTHFLTGCITFHFKDAIRYNYAAPFIVFYIAYIIISTSIRYVKTGKWSVRVKYEWLNYVFLVILLAWAVLRNIYKM